ncbi:MAG TPA: ATP-grasp domain-containing protein [Ramlibacter sp.]|nr:ATP-grasp domain-containing protein [Ramlibacter sp.]
MNLFEYEGKQLFRRHGIATPRGRIARSPAEAIAVAAELGSACVLKAQVAAGGRGKAGLVKFADGPEQAGRAAAELLGATGAHEVELLLVEEKLAIADELYLSIKVDDVLGTPIVIASCAGGVEVESNTDRIHTLAVDVRQGVRRHHAAGLWKKAGATGARLQQLASVTVALWNAFSASDAELVEINPLVFDRDGKCWAADAKVSIDDNALRRQPEFAVRPPEAKGSLLERRAARLGVNSLIELGGNVAIISTGASFGMLILDRLQELGARPANFMDMGGQSSVLAREKIVDLMATHVRNDPSVKAVLIALIQTSKPILHLVSALRAGFEGKLPHCPVFCWIGAAHMATQECSLADALAQLDAVGIRTFTNFDDALQASADAARA